MKNRFDAYFYKLGKQYPCSYCGKILYSSQYVKKHEATHTGQKFKGVNCKYCGKLVEYTKVNNNILKISYNKFMVIVKS